MVMSLMVFKYLHKTRGIKKNLIELFVDLTLQNRHFTENKRKM